MPASDLPPGCSVSDIPGNRPEDLAAEALNERIGALLEPHGLGEDEQLIDAIAVLIGEAYGQGRSDMHNEEGLAREIQGRPRPNPVFEFWKNSDLLDRFANEICVGRRPPAFNMAPENVLVFTTGDRSRFYFIAYGEPEIILSVSTDPMNILDEQGDAITRIGEFATVEDAFLAMCTNADWDLPTDTSDDLPGTHLEDTLPAETQGRDKLILQPIGNNSAPRFGLFGSSLKIEQDCGNQTTEIRTRRVNPVSGEGEQVQIEITIDTHHEKRTHHTHGHLVLAPAAAAILVTSLTKLLPPHQQRPAAEDRAFYASFYGIPDKRRA